MTRWTRKPGPWARQTLLATLALAAAGVATAQPATASTPPAPLEHSVQRFATAEFLPYIDRTAPEGGYYKALLRRVLAHHGEHVAFVERPWARAHAETRDGRFDGSFPYIRSPSRERDFLFSDALLDVPSYLFVRRAEATGDVAGRVERATRTCYLRDSLLPPGLEARLAAGQLEVVRVDDMAQCFRMLVAGRVPFVPAGIYSGRGLLQRLYPDGAAPIVAVGEPLDRSSQHLVWPRRDPRSAARREAFNASLAVLRAEGEVERLQVQLLPQPGPVDASE
jgi:polar amino acid transport system substrate-binding protein